MGADRVMGDEREMGTDRVMGAERAMPAQTNILETIAAANRERVAREKALVPAAEMRERAEAAAARERAATGKFVFPFEQALRAPGMSFICECKKASPSKGLIAPDYDPVAIARDYEAAGAAAISCLTEPRWFQGSVDDLAAVAHAVDIPVLRKDFVVDDYMVWEAKAAGAAAVVGLTPLVEAYAPSEVPRAIAAGARVIGVNNRDLRTFQVDFGRSIDLRPLVGPDRIFVSESGVHDARDVARLASAQVDAVLIGETLMRSADKRAALDALRSEL